MALWVGSSHAYLYLYDIVYLIEMAYSYFDLSNGRMSGIRSAGYFRGDYLSTIFVFIIILKISSMMKVQYMDFWSCLDH